jgi:hypothetical protein
VIWKFFAHTTMDIKVIEEVHRLDLQQLEIPSSAVITNVKHLSSYNWIEAPTPTIVVPGCPALWSPPDAPHQLKRDSGLVYIAQNTAVHPDSPIEPLFRALYVVHPSFNIHSTDVVTERNNLRKLLSFVSSRDGTRNPFHAFSVKVEAVKNTIVLCRIESATHEFIGPNEFKGFGHEFERAYTTDQIKNSIGHHRIISYQFGGLSFIICHETDGYADQSHTIRSSSKNKESQLSGASGTISPSTVYHSLSCVPSVASRLTVREGGHEIPIGLTLEIKTRVSHKPILIDDVGPQMWMSQTPKLVRAYHRGGLFQRPHFDDVTDEINSWEAHNEPDLKKLAALIKRIITIVRACGTAVILKYDPLGDKLVFSAVNGGKMLPEDLYMKWAEPKAKMDSQTTTDDLPERK